MSDQRHAYEHAETIPSIDHDRALGARIVALQVRYPSHTLVRPPRIRGGVVMDTIAPLDPVALRSAREHYRGGGIVRLHARKAAELSPAASEIRS